MPIRVKLHSSLRSPSASNAAQKTVALTRFPALFAAHWQTDPSTKSVELYAREFVRDDMPANRIWGFVRMVCGWGGDRYVGQRIIDQNGGSTRLIRARFREGLRYLNEGETANAIASMDDVPGLGISYGSKHLKFLNPQLAVVLDSKISSAFGYPLNSEGYAEFVGRCAAIATTLNEKGPPCCRTRSGRWRISDVEMAIFKLLP